MPPLRFAIVLALPVLPCLAYSAEEEANWSFQVLIGDAYNFESHTRIEHESWGERSFDGDYETRGLEGPLHYAWRISRWVDDRGWELQLLHHKIYLQDPPAGVEALSVSHGFNIVSVNRSLKYRGWILRGGVGPVITHAEANVLGTSYDGPYEVAGAAALLGVARELELGEHFRLLGEISATFGYIDAHPDGTPELGLTIRNPAIHAQVGVGYRF